MSKQAAFLQGASQATSQVLDTLFGKRLFSLQMVAVSTSYSLASLLFFLAISSFVPVNPVVGDGIGILLLVLGTIPAVMSGKAFSSRVRNPDAWRHRYCEIAVVAVIGTAFLCAKYYFEMQESSPILPIAVLCGVLTDTMFIVIFRWILRKTTSLSSLWKLGLLIVAVSIVGVSLVGPSIALLDCAGTLASAEDCTVNVAGIGISISAGDVQFNSVVSVILTSATNWLDAICALLIVVVMALLLLHRVLWPLIKRPIYAANRKQLVKNSKLLGTLGGVSTLYAFPNNPIARFVVHFVSILK
jgi:hypothetical protein